MENNEIYEKWKATQLQWDDTDFLSKTANNLMKKRWKRLDLMIGKITAEEVVRKNEYVTFLDLGAGRGDFYKYVKDSVKKYTGVEPSEKMLEYEIAGEDFELKKGCGEEFESAQLYDICLIKEVLDHTYDPGKVVENAFKCLLPGGIVVVTLTDKDSYYKKLLKKRTMQLEKEHEDHLYNFNPEEVKKLCEKAGFKTEKIISYNYLRLPYFLENFLGALPLSLVFWLLDVTDTVGRMLLKNSGGSFIIIGRKEEGL